MSNEPLTDQEAQTLFRQTAKAIQESDSIKLTELLEQKAPEEKTEPEVKTEEAKVEESKSVEEDSSANTDKKEVAEQEQSPLEKADEAVKNEEVKSEEPSELDKLKEELARVSKENQALRSQAGRVPHLQHRMHEIDKKLEEFAKQKASPSSNPSTRSQPRVQEILKGVKETDPELADAIANAIGEATKEVASDMSAKEEATLQLLRQQEYQEYQEHQATRLLEMFPNAAEVFQSPHWTDWKKKQTPRIVELADSDTADDVAFVFRKYTDDMKTLYPELTEQAATVKAEPTASVVNEQAEKAKQIEAERARKKEASVSIGTPAAPAKESMPDDPNALFRKYSEEIQKKRMGIS